MKTTMRKKRCRTKTLLLCVLAATCLLLGVNAQAFTVNVVDDSGTPITGGFRWLLEEDNTNVTAPGVSVRVSISTDIHKSHAPVVNQGSAAAASATITEDINGSTLDDTKQYFISILPNDIQVSGYSNGGAVVTPAVVENDGTVTVTVNSNPIPTAQISVLAFVDHNPINNVFDTGEQGLGGATVILSDTAGQVSQDAFGNPLGTRYDTGGNVTQLGTGVITTLTQDQFDSGTPSDNPYDLDVGEVLIKYLVPGKYGIVIIPPNLDDTGGAISWSQTATIEGTPTVDAWVKANEPELFVEGFGTGFNHVFIGFVKVSPLGASEVSGQSFSALEWNQTAPLNATGSISGTLRMNHFSKPPDLQGYYPGISVPNCWVGLNETIAFPGVVNGGLNAGKYAARCNADSSFTIPDVPPGTYQLVTWDQYLDTLFGIHTVTVPAGASGTGEAVELGNVLTFRWFGTLENYVFYDEDEDGFRDDGETGIPEQNVNLRFRDGTIYQAFPTDLEGYVPFDEVFPFFKWLVVEVDYARFKATGMTTAIDDGGPIPGPGWPALGNKNPQMQDPNDPFNLYGDTFWRTETGPVLTQAMHLFLGQANLIEWGKKHYADGENGGISGMVFYAVTRAEDDPRYAAAEPWEPGVPRVQVNLYRDEVINATGAPGSDGIIDDLDGNGEIELADVDNYPFRDTTPFPGPEDIDVLSDGFSMNDALQVTTTDSWDDNQPSGCIQDLPDFGLGPINECTDNFGTWNQVRPGVFDGGYAFDGIDAGSYIVEAVTPPGYELLKEEDKNVDFGIPFEPSPLLLPPTCVGQLHTVASVLSFDGTTEAPFAGEQKPYCDFKAVNLNSGANAAADFFVLTQVPKAARSVGFVNNDLGAEFNQGSPIFGEKLAPPWIPISYKDWQGNEIVRVYSDEFGSYNAMLPSTYTVNVASPTGVSPNMITIVLNDPFMADGSLDPYYDPDYTVTPWTWHYFPGATTYTDTPIIPVAAFTTAEVRLDTAPQDGTPVIDSVVTDFPRTGPLVCTDSDLGSPVTVSINAPSGGTIDVRNPDYPVNSTDPTITRSVGFGTDVASTVTLNGAELSTITGVSNINWTDTLITFDIASGISQDDYQLAVNRANGQTSETGVTLTVTDCSGLTVRPVTGGSEYPATSLQDAIDLAAAGDIVLVGPGTYKENVIMNKPVLLKGSGRGTIISGNPEPIERLQDWQDAIALLGAQDYRDLVGINPFSANEAPAIIVIGQRTGVLNDGLETDFTSESPVIDGFSLIGSKAGGGIFAVDNVKNLVISNNDISGNQGSYGGGIVVGSPGLGNQTLLDGVTQLDLDNDDITIRYNKIHKNGGIQGGGGIALNDGAENYMVENNLIAGNFGRFNGGGIQHRGYIPGNNMIQNNRILFNEVFFGAVVAQAGDGAGIFIGGEGAGGEGAGNVTIDSNLIQGNMSGAGNGGGIRAFAINGADIEASPGDDTNWYTLDVTNNIIVNNVAGLSGAGISLQDAARATIVHNTIANNDTTSTSVQAFAVGQPNSTPQPSGVVSAPHSTPLAGITGFGETFSDPVLVNNIIYQNRSYFNDASLNGGAGGLAENPNGLYWDLHVLESVASGDPQLSPDYCLLTNGSNQATGDNYPGTNVVIGGGSNGPGFLAGYVNTIQSTTVVDEGGNNINVRFTPLLYQDENATSDYHIADGGAFNAGGTPGGVTIPALDYDGEPRPFVGPPTVPDIGADEIQSNAPPAAPAALAPAPQLVSASVSTAQVEPLSRPNQVGPQVGSLPESNQAPSPSAASLQAGADESTVFESASSNLQTLTQPDGEEAIVADSFTDAAAPADNAVSSSRTLRIVRESRGTIGTGSTVGTADSGGSDLSASPPSSASGAPQSVDLDRSIADTPGTINMGAGATRNSEAVEQAPSLSRVGNEEQNVALVNDSAPLLAYSAPAEEMASLVVPDSGGSVPAAKSPQVNSVLDHNGDMAAANDGLFNKLTMGLIFIGLAFLLAVAFAIVSRFVNERNPQ